MLVLGLHTHSDLETIAEWQSIIPAHVKTYFHTYTHNPVQQTRSLLCKSLAWESPLIKTQKPLNTLLQHSDQYNQQTREALFKLTWLKNDTQRIKIL